MATPAAEAEQVPPSEPVTIGEAKDEAAEEEEEEEEAVEEEEMAIGDDEEQMMATTENGELVEMVPCALLEDGELVELQDASGKTAYIALDGAVTDETAPAGQSLIYYATPYTADIEGLEPYAAGAAGNGPHAKGYLDGQFSAAKASAVPADRLAGSRAETPEEVKTQKEKTIARVVMAVACTLLTLCVVLVGVTLSMSEHINDMVRQMHLKSKPDGKAEFKPPDVNATGSFASSSSRESSTL